MYTQPTYRSFTITSSFNCKLPLSYDKTSALACVQSRREEHEERKRYCDSTICGIISRSRWNVTAETLLRKKYVWPAELSILKVGRCKSSRENWYLTIIVVIAVVWMIIRSLCVRESVELDGYCVSMFRTRYIDIVLLYLSFVSF